MRAWRGCGSVGGHVPVGKSDREFLGESSAQRGFPCPWGSVEKDDPVP